MAFDSIIAEVRQARDVLAQRFNYDLRAIIQDARARQQAGGRKVVTLAPRPARRTTSTPSPNQPLQQAEPALRRRDAENRDLGAEQLIRPSASDELR